MKKLLFVFVFVLSIGCNVYSLIFSGYVERRHIDNSIVYESLKNHEERLRKLETKNKLYSSTKITFLG